MKSLLMIAGLGLIAATPSFAADRAPKPAAVSASVSVPQAASVTTQPPRLVRYCAMTEQTGTRLRKKVCRTRDEWLDDGFDPLTK